MQLPADYDHELKSFEGHVKRIASLVRETLAYHNIPDFHFSIDVSGRCSAGSAKLQYRLGERYGSAVTASTIRPLVEEFLRRKGFDNLHAAVELPPPGGYDSAPDNQPYDTDDPGTPF